MHAAAQWTRRLWLTAGMLLAAAAPAQTTFTWTGGTSTAWSNASNWSPAGGPPGATAIARFNAATSRDPTLGGTAAAVGRVAFLSGVDAKTLGGTATLTLNGVSGVGLTNSSGLTQTIAAGVALGAAQTWTTTGAGSDVTLTRTLNLGSFTLTLNSATGTTFALGTAGADVISGTGAVVKNGAGAVTFGSDANTFSGGFRLNAGTATIGGDAALGTGGLTLAGGTLAATGDVTLANPLTISGSATLSGNAGVDWVFSSGTIGGGAGTLTLDNTSGSGRMSVGFSGSGFSLARAINLSDAFTELRMLPSAGTQTYSGVISGAGAVRVDAAGGTVVLGGANTFSGGLVHAAGTLQANNNSALGAGTLALAGGTLIATADRTMANNLLVSASSTIAATGGIDLVFAGNSITGSGGTLSVANTSGSGLMSLGFSGSGFTFARPVALSDAFTELRLLNTSGTQTFSGVISGSGRVRVNGLGGAVALNAANTFSGGVILDAGTLSVGANTALGSGTLDLSGGTLTAAADRTLANALTLSASSTLAAPAGVDLAFSTGTLSTTGGTLTLANTSGAGLMSARFTGSGFTFTRPIAFGDSFSALRSSNTSGTQTFSGVISGSGNIRRDAAGGATILSGNNSGFTGNTTLTAGTLRIDHNNALGTGTLTLGGGALTATADRTLPVALLITANTAVSAAPGIDFVFSSNNISGTGGTLSLDATSAGATVSLGFSGNGFTFARPIALNDSNTELRFLNSSGTQTFTGAISGSGAVRRDGAGGIVVLSGLNSYTGSTTIAGGTLQLGAAGNGTQSPLGTTAAGTTVSSGAALDLNGVSLSTAEALTISGTAVGLGGALTNSSATAAAYQGAVTLGANASIGGAGNITLSAALTGNFQLTKTGGGMLALNAASARSGATRLESGTLRLGNTSALGLTSPNVTLAGGTLDLATNTSVSAYPIVVSASSTIASNKATAASAGIDHNLGSLNLNAGSTLGIARGNNVGSGVAGVTFSSAQLGATGATFDVASGARLTLGSVGGSGRSFTVTGDGDTFITGAIAIGTGSVTKEGGGTLSVAAASSYTGATTINQGTLRLAGAGTAANTPIGNISGTATVNSGGALDLAGYTLAGAKPIALSGSGVGATGALTNSGGAATYAGAITLNGATTIGGPGNITLSGSFSAAGVALTKTGGGTLTFSGSGTTTGAVALNDGTLAVAGGSTLNTGALSAVAGTTLMIASGGTVVTSTSASTTFSGAMAGAGTLELTGSGTLALNQSFNASGLTLVLAGGTLSLSGGGFTFGAVHITGNTTIDFNGAGGTFLASAALVIDPGVSVTIANWVWAANNAAASTTWFATGTINGVAITSGDIVGGVPLNQVSFTSHPGLMPMWSSGTQNGWFNHEIRPTPEPATYGAWLGVLVLAWTTYWRIRFGGA